MLQGSVGVFLDGGRFVPPKNLQKAEAKICRVKSARLNLIKNHKNIYKYLILIPLN